MRITTHLALGLASIVCFAGAVQAQEERAADHTITLTKVVEVYEFEDIRVSINLYEVQRGDSISDILRGRGVLDAVGDEARMLRLVKNLNPELRDLNKIQPGQVLQLPTELAGEGDEAPLISETTPLEPATVTDTVKVYERSQPTQQSAKIVVMRHRPGSGTVELAPGAASGADPTTGTGSPLDFPSGNPGPLAMEPDTGVVYRTVKIRRGDTLERLLRREGMDNGLIYAHLLKLTLELNPEINNQDLIFAGAELRIPAAGDYLAATGANPAAVKEAALARAQGRKVDSGRAGVLELPSEAIETAKNTLGLIFTRLGGRIDTRGRLVLPRGNDSIEFNTAQFPMVELPGERRVVLDLEARLPRNIVRALGEMPGYAVFRPARGAVRKNFRQALDKLWPLCGFYRVYGKEERYEGGTDIKLQILADWMIWPTEEAWKNGQPLALNLAVAPNNQTDAAWKGFLAQHGVEVLDIYQGALLPDDVAPTGVAEPQVTRLSETNPSLLAAELVKILGAEPKVGVQLDGLAPVEDSPKNAATAPVLWTNKGRQVVLDFGELAPEAIATMRDEGYLVVESESRPDAVVAAVLEGFGLAAQEAMILKAPAGGPEMSLTVKGRFVPEQEGRGFFFTALDLPQGIAALLPPGLKIIRY